MNSWLQMKPFRMSLQAGAFLWTKVLAAIFPSFQSVLQKMLHPKAHVNLYSRDAMLSAIQGDLMAFPFQRTILPLLALVFALLIACAAAAPASAQEKKVAQKNGVDISKMGPTAHLHNTCTPTFRRVTWRPLRSLGPYSKDSGTRPKSMAAIPPSQEPTASSSMKSIEPWISSLPPLQKQRASLPIPPG